MTNMNGNTATDVDMDNPLTLLMNLRDGLNNEPARTGTNNAWYHADLKLASASTMPFGVADTAGGSGTRNGTGHTLASSKKPFTVPLSLEEQQEIEEPIEIDLRNICKTYGINPVDTRQKLFRKQSNDILNFAIGEAYMKFIHGKSDEAITLLFELIRMNPLNSEPYDSLGDIYREMGNYDRALEFYLLGIQFNQNDSKRWAELAELAHFNKLNRSAIEFYSKAIKISPRTVTYYIKKCNLLEELKQYDNVHKTYARLLNYLEPDDYKIIVSIVFRIAHVQCYNMKQPAEALDLVQLIIRQHSIESDPDKFASFLLYVDVYFDLLLINQRAGQVLRKFIQYKLIKLDSESEQSTVSDQMDEAETAALANLIVDRYRRGDPLFADPSIDDSVKSKLVCALIYLGKLEQVSELMAQFEQLSEPKSLQESIYRAFVRALIEVEQYRLAYKYASRLVQELNSSKYWYWCGLCLSQMKLTEDAIVAYENAISYDANNYEAVNELSVLCNQIGKPERALDNLSLDHLFSMDLKLLLNRCNLLYTCKRWNEFVCSARQLLSSDIYFIEDWGHVGEIIAHTVTKMGLIKFVKGMRKRYSKLGHRVKLSGGGHLSCEQMLDVLRKTLFVLLNFSKDYEQAILVAFSSLLSSHAESCWLVSILLSFRCCYEAKYRPYTYELCTLLLKHYPRSAKVWYAFSAMMSDIYQNCRHKRFCMRIWNAHPDNVNALLMNGHIALLNGRYQHGLGIYMLLYRLQSSYRYDSFHVALCYLHLITQSHTRDKSSIFVQMLAFFRDYMLKIGKCQEFYYNLGRACHQLGLYNVARQMYELALRTPLKIYDKRFDLCPEIAFNLSQIYRLKQDHRQANRLRLQYCTI